MRSDTASQTRLHCCQRGEHRIWSARLQLYRTVGAALLHLRLACAATNRALGPNRIVAVPAAMRGRSHAIGATMSITPVVLVSGRGAHITQPATNTHARSTTHSPQAEHLAARQCLQVCAPMCSTFTHNSGMLRLPAYNEESPRTTLIRRSRGARTQVAKKRWPPQLSQRVQLWVSAGAPH